MLAAHKTGNQPMPHLNRPASFFGDVGLIGSKKAKIVGLVVVKFRSFRVRDCADSGIALGNEDSSNDGISVVLVIGYIFKGTENVFASFVIKRFCAAGANPSWATKTSR